MDAAATPRDLKIWDPGGAQLVLRPARCPEHRMRVRVYESWRQQAAVTVDLIGVWKASTQIVVGSDCNNAFPLHRHADPLYDTGVGHLGAASCTRRTGSGERLCGIDE